MPGLNAEIKEDRQEGISEGLGLFSFTRLAYCFLDADRLQSFHFHSQSNVSDS